MLKQLYEIWPRGAIRRILMCTEVKVLVAESKVVRLEFMLGALHLVVIVGGGG